jgi:hypothetical protein
MKREVGLMKNLMKKREKETVNRIDRRIMTTRTLGQALGEIHNS